MAFSVLIKNERAKLQGWTNARQLGASYALFRKELQGKVACMLSLFRCKDEDFFFGSSQHFVGTAFGRGDL